MERQTVKLQKSIREYIIKDFYSCVLSTQFIKKKICEKYTKKFCENVI